MKVGRNDRCPCGSGKKFKACHMDGGGLSTERATFVGTPGPGKASVRDWPSVDDACRCAMPIVFSEHDAPEVPGTQGTCFGVRLSRGVVFVTAAHVVRAIDETAVEIPVAFGEGHREALRIAHVDYVEPLRPEHADVCDLAVMVPSTQPSGGPPYFRPIGIDTIANVATMRAPQLYVVAGYPRNHPDGNSVDYDGKVIDFRLFHAIGTYESPSSALPGCHTLKISTAAVGGADGLSGSPVLRVVFDKKRTASCALAGVVIRGNAELVHFIGIDFVATVLRKEEAAFFERRARPAGTTTSQK